MERKRQRVANDTTSSPPTKRLVRDDNDALEFPGLLEVENELSSIDDLLQKEETSQRQTWQIGKRVKRLLESYEFSLPISKQLDAYFLWGTALARLASLNEDPTLADAAADKFQQILELSGDGAELEDAVDAALGPVGYSLWGSSLLIVATETQSREVLDQALAKFQRAVEVDGGTTFETRFQYAKALKEGGDLVTFLDEDEGVAGFVKTNSYYDRAVQVCKKLEDIYQVESKKMQENDEEGEKLTVIEDGGNGGEKNDDEDDKVTVEDFAEVKLLEAVLQGLLDDPSSVDSFYRTVALYQAAIALHPGNAKALMETTDTLAARCLANSNFGTSPSASEWIKLFDGLEAQYKRLLADGGFDLQECHEICYRKDTHDQNEPEEKEIDEEVPYLLNALGKGLAAFVRTFPHFDGDIVQEKKKSKQKCQDANGNARFTHAVEILRSAHHFHDKLGCYYLACLYASPAFEDEKECRIWLETADSYGALEDEFDVQEFATMHVKAWFKHLAQPPAQVKEIEGEEQESGEEDDG